MSASKLWRVLWAVPVLIGLAVGLVAWDLFFLPTSFNEALFRYRLGNAVEGRKTEIALAELASFEWEEVCTHHPYDGAFKHPKYGRTYHAPMNASRDGVWVLLFIDKLGNPTYVSGSCTRGGADIHEFGCRSRSNAVFRSKKSEPCPTYSAIPIVKGQ